MMKLLDILSSLNVNLKIMSYDSFAFFHLRPWKKGKKNHLSGATTEYLKISRNHIMGFYPFTLTYLLDT